MRTHPFKSQENLNKMLILRAKGWTYKSLANIYGCDHSSIYHWCKRFDISKVMPEIVFDASNIITLITPIDPRSQFTKSILSLILKKKPTSYLEYLKQ